MRYLLPNSMWYTGLDLHTCILKRAAYPRLRARISIKFYLLVINALKISVKFFDWATILKIDPFPYKGIMWFELQMDSLIIRVFIRTLEIGEATTLSSYYTFSQNGDHTKDP